ncbi:ATP-binding protein [Deinococcus sp. Leaf326]|uniref:sensor histidine kinase n=1 Tax=Deinococcus sp. Leaf326 TaxID=1736338 RepID=UPI0006F570A9|nr:ATP-binding protein [Deinococcus sp. Leaf326]KQR00972.1 hypothetical protein ASF71_12400 [Deinococcus sp. Leaf326]
MRASSPTFQPQQAVQLARAVIPPARWRRWRMWQRFFWTQVLIFTFLTLVLGAVQYTSLTGRTRQEYGDRALMLSRTVATMPTVQTYFTRPEIPLQIDPLLQAISRDIGADFLVVGGRLGMRYAHPFPADLAQKISVSSSTDDVLGGGDPVEVGTRQLKDFIWGKAEVMGPGQTIIGVVSTGFRLPTVQASVQGVMRALLPWYGFSLLFALLSSLIVSRRLRRDLFDLEPDQISGLVSQHHAVLTALEDGVLVLSGQQVTLANQRALDLLRVHEVAALPALPALWPELHALLRAAADQTLVSRPLTLAGHSMLVTRSVLPSQQHLILFRRREEAMRLAEELTQTRQYVNLLRSQTHEFTNRLHTIAGLIQIGRAELALQIVQRESGEAQEISDRVRSIAPPRLAALLVGKFARARELGTELRLDEACGLEDTWPEPVIDALVLALGNLIENAFDAVQGRPEPVVSVLLGEDHEGLQLEVRDTGPGLTPAELERWQTAGFTTKGPGHGQGLTLIRQQLFGLQGQLEYRRMEGETVFIVSIPRPSRGTW